MTRRAVARGGSLCATAVKRGIKLRGAEVLAELQELLVQAGELGGVDGMLEVLDECLRRGVLHRDEWIRGRRQVLQPASDTDEVEYLETFTHTAVGYRESGAEDLARTLANRGLELSAAVRRELAA